MPRIQAVSLRAVTHMYGGHPALRRVSLEIAPGPILFIQGANGAGKSTLISILATIQRPTAGEVQYHPFGDDYRLARAHIGWAGHDSHCYRDLTVRENIEFAAALYAADPARAWTEAEARLGLSAFAGQRVATLSAGQRQRTSLARALVHQPSSLLLDEPLSGLDAATRELAARLMREEAARGTMVVVVTHDPGFATQMGGRIIELERGALKGDRAPALAGSTVLAS